MSRTVSFKLFRTETLSADTANSRLRMLLPSDSVDVSNLQCQSVLTEGGATKKKHTLPSARLGNGVPTASTLTRLDLCSTGAAIAVFEFLAPAQVFDICTVCKSWTVELRRAGLLMKGARRAVEANLEYRAARKLEARYMVDNYFPRQSEITVENRKTLVDWMIEIHYDLEYPPETLFLAVRLVDRLLQAMTVKRKDYQLAGCTCIRLAAKKVELDSAPSTQYLVAACQGIYTAQQIEQAEQDIQLTLYAELNLAAVSAWDAVLTSPTVFTFMCGLAKEYQFTPKALALATYLAETCLCDGQLLGFHQSRVAVAVAALSLYQLGLSYSALLAGSGYEARDLAEPAQIALNAAREASTEAQRTIRAHYSREEHYSVASLRLAQDFDAHLFGKPLRWTVLNPAKSQSEPFATRKDASCSTLTTSAPAAAVSVMHSSGPTSEAMSIRRNVESRLLNNVSADSPTQSALA